MSKYIVENKTSGQYKLFDSERSAIICLQDWAKQIGEE